MLPIDLHRKYLQSLIEENPTAGVDLSLFLVEQCLSLTQERDIHLSSKHKMRMDLNKRPAIPLYAPLGVSPSGRSSPSRLPSPPGPPPFSGGQLSKMPEEISSPVVSPRRAHSHLMSPAAPPFLRRAISTPACPQPQVDSPTACPELFIPRELLVDLSGATETLSFIVSRP